MQAHRIDPVVLGAVARLDGLEGSRWTTDLQLVDLGGGGARVRLTPLPAADWQGAREPVTLDVPAGGSLTVADADNWVALGAAEVKLVDMVYSFSVFANGGTMLGAPKKPQDVQPGYRQLDPVAILQVNDAVCRISGYSRQELLQRYDQQNVHPDDAAVGQEQYSRVLKGELDHFQVEKRYRRKSGEVFWARLTLSAVRGSDGHPLYLVGMLEDVDDQKLAQKSLTESEARFRAMFDTFSVGVTLIATDRRG